MRHRVAILIALLVVVWWTTDSPFTAGPYYVDNSCANNGNGLAQSCASSPNGLGAFNGLQAAVTVPLAGETLKICKGNATYVTSAGTGYNNGAGFNITHSGTAGNLITITACDPADPPLLAACADGTTSLATCNRQVTGAQNQAYVKWSYLKIRGSIVWDNCDNCEMDHLEVTQGYAPAGDGNWSGIMANHSAGGSIHHTYVHDLEGLGGENVGAGLKMFAWDGGLFEYNTVKTGPLATNTCAINDKDSSHRTVIRYNWLESSAGGWCGPNQTSDFPNTGDILAHNVITSTPGVGNHAFAIRYGDGSSATTQEMYSNTLFNYVAGIYQAWAAGITATNFELYNNIFAGLVSQNILDDGGTNNTTYAKRDYNLYTSGKAWQRPGLSTTTFTTYQADVSPQEAASQALSAFGFVSTTAGSEDFHLTAGSAAKNACKTGGTSGGTTIDCGAYSEGIDCVGHACADTTPSGRPVFRNRRRGGADARPPAVLPVALELVEAPWR